jgi:hypothetical protein
MKRQKDFPPSSERVELEQQTMEMKIETAAC